MASHNNKTPNGRLTSGAAYAMLSRAMLYAERWDDARIAAEEVMGMGYKLEEKENYSNAFKAGSQEAILQYCYDKSSTVTHDFDGYMAPGGDKALDGNSMTGGFGTPTQEMVESYEYADGSGFPDWSTWHTAEGTTATRLVSQTGTVENQLPHTYRCHKTEPYPGRGNRQTSQYYLCR